METAVEGRGLVEDPTRPIDRIPSIVARLYALVAELSAAFPGRPFTPDGHLVGSIGEVLASHYYGLTLLPCSSECHDATAADGRLVQVKATQGRSVVLGAEPDYLLVLHLKPDGTFDEAYSGPGDIPWREAGRVGKHGYRPISLAKLRRLAQGLTKNQNILQLVTSAAHLV